MHTFTEKDSSQGADRCGDNGRTDDRSRVNAAILLAVGNDIYGDQLKGRNVDDEKITHFIAGSAGEFWCIVKIGGI